jgi:hypothetical protein
MKKIAILWFILVTLTGYAQNAPYFEMPIYFEDGIGNKDTIVVGYDLYAQNCNSIIETTPMDSVFEVRAAKGNVFPGSNEISYKRYIIDAEPTTVGDSVVIFGVPFRIVASIKHLPLKISWDSTYLEDFWRHSTFFSPDYLTHVYPDFWWAQRITCMAMQNSFTDDFSYRVGALEGVWVTVGLPVEGQGIVELPAYQLVFTWGEQCQQAVSTKAVAGVQPILIAPNPVQDIVRLGLPMDKTYESLRIYTPDGKEVIYTPQPTDFAISVGSLPKGVYFVQVVSTDRQQWVGKFLKF